MGAWQGALFGGVSGALQHSAFVSSLNDPANLSASWQPQPVAYTRNLAEVTVRARRLVGGAAQVQSDFLASYDYLAYLGSLPAPLATGAVTPYYGIEASLIPILPKGMFAIPRLRAGSIREVAEEIAVRNFNKITDNLLKKSGIDAHQIKRDFLGAKARISQYDLYKHTRTGEILILQKGGKGLPIQTGEFLK